MCDARLIVKICGITRVSDARLALAEGADWIGLNLVGGPRRIDPAKALDILSKLPDPSAAVALVFVDDPELPRTLESLAKSGVRRLQVYGNGSEPAIHRDVRCTAHPACSPYALLATRGFEVIWVRHIRDAVDLRETGVVLRACQPQPHYVLLDTHVVGQQGGTGRRLDWAMLAEQKKSGQLDDWPPILLAGGLNPENVAEAISLFRPAGVDVSSGVESRPGVKDSERVRAFVAAARRAFPK